MADGTSWRTSAPANPAPRLGQAVAGRSTLWAKCGCGARQASLEIRGLAEAPQGVTGAIFIFR
jgi:hypothetical protein